MILLFTDFGAQDIYVGQVKARILADAPGALLVDLLHEAPSFDVLSAAHLLAAMSGQLPPTAVTLAVVDPGVGSARRAVALRADGRWYVGPDNGLLSVIAARAGDCRVWEIVWRPDVLSTTFHGRDLFAPIAAMLERNDWWPAALLERDRLQVSCDVADLERIVYVDHYGNAMTGIRAGMLSPNAVLEVSGQNMEHARTFAEAPAGALFWYGNSIGLVEIAMNRGSAAGYLGLSPGDRVRRVS